LDAFLCGNICVNAIGKALRPFDEEIEDKSIDPKTHTLTIYPSGKKPLDLYEIRQELRNAERIPWKIEIIVTGKVIDYQKIYSGGEMRPRKALKIEATDQQFILIEGTQRDMLLEAVTERQEVTIFGEIPAFNEKSRPVLVIKDFKVVKEKKSKAEG